MKKLNIMIVFLIILTLLTINLQLQFDPAELPNQPYANKISYIPLDDRPVNYKKVIELAESSALKFDYPSIQDLKSNAYLNNWLNDNYKQTKAFIISLDMLAYGGLVESRKHSLNTDELLKRIQVIKDIKSSENSVYAFVTVMRAPSSNIPHTMPPYYEKYGAQIFKYGELKDKCALGIASQAERERFEQLILTIPKDYLNDFISRRQKNFLLNQEILKLTQQGFIDYLVISKDDNSPYGFTRMETAQLQELANKLGIGQKVRFFAGTDECGMLLFVATVNKMNNMVPNIFVDYSQPDGASLIPPYEDKPMDDNITQHILAIGANRVTDINNSDLILAVHNRGLKGNPQQAVLNETNFIKRINTYINEGKPVTVGDVKFPNGADPDFLMQLNKEIDLSKLAGYSGWNTAGNSIGITLSSGILFNAAMENNVSGYMESYNNSLLTNLIEDWGYQAVVRPNVKPKVPVVQQTLFTDHELENIITNDIQTQLNDYAKTNLVEDFGEIRIDHVKLPWHRLFDIEFSVHLP